MLQSLYPDIVFICQLPLSLFNFLVQGGAWRRAVWLAGSVYCAINLTRLLSQNESSRFTSREAKHRSKFYSDLRGASSNHQSWIGSQSERKINPSSNGRGWDEEECRLSEQPFKGGSEANLTGHLSLEDLRMTFTLMHGLSLVSPLTPPTFVDLLGRMSVTNATNRSVNIFIILF